MAISEIDGVPVMCTTELKNRLGMYISADLIEGLGLAPKLKSPTGVYWRECDFSVICDLLINHLKKLQRES